MSFTRLPVARSVLRSAGHRSLPSQVRHATTTTSSSSSTRARGQPEQKMTGLTAAGLGLAALLGWSAVILSVEGRRTPSGGHPGRSETVHHVAHVVKDKVEDLTSTATEAVAGSSASSSSSSADTAASDQDHSQSAAYDPETGEINWDCPCLGGMAHGPCGEEFKAAFSCFVHSEEEVKGVDCVDKFRGMQECFRKHPDVYGTDADEEEDDEFDLIERAEAALKDDEEFEPVVKA